MLYIMPDGTIKLTRGDTARLTVSIDNHIDGTQAEYVMSANDTLTLSMKKSIKDSTPCLQKTITGSNTFYIEPNDTRNLEFRKYKYDVQLTTSAGDVYTIIEPSDFEIMEEVTC